MPNFLYVFQLLRYWQIDENIPTGHSGSATPIITVLPAEIVGPPEKKNLNNGTNKDKPLGHLHREPKRIMNSSDKIGLKMKMMADDANSDQRKNSSNGRKPFCVSDFN